MNIEYYYIFLGSVHIWWWKSDHVNCVIIVIKWSMEITTKPLYPTSLEKSICLRWKTAEEEE